MKQLLVLLMLVPLAANAAGEKTCKKAPTLTGACRMVKGSLGLTSGIGVTLNTEDGSRIVIKAPAGTNADIAPKVMQNWLYWQSKTGAMRTLADESSRPRSRTSSSSSSESSWF